MMLAWYDGRLTKSKYYLYIMAVKSNKKKPSLADKADRHDLYQQSVQCVEAEIDFVDETFSKLRKRNAIRLREDFCGTANTSCEWVQRRRSNFAIGVDLDNDVLAWGREHNIGSLKPAQRQRIQLHSKDVLKIRTDPVDIVLAMNFSYWLFQKRKTMLKYFRSVYSSLSKDGIFFLDAYGGYDCPREITEKTDHGDFTYIWDQAAFNPINNEMECFIHFKFKDGSKLDKAFSYTWRLWGLPDIREMLAEAGFSKTTVHIQGTDDETGEGNGIFSPAEIADADPGWIAYVVAEP